jgi:hypothetical protein
MKKITMSLALLLASVLIASSQPVRNWEVIGRKTVNYRAEVDIIPVTIVKGTYSKIKIYVTGGAVNFADMKIFYRNGQVQDVSLRATIPAGGESRVIDLDGKERIITKIQFVYDTKNTARHRAKVVVYARE